MIHLYFVRYILRLCNFDIFINLALAKQINCELETTQPNEMMKILITYTSAHGTTQSIT